MATISPSPRFVALDIHRKYLVVVAVDQEQQVVLPPRRFGFEAFSAWAPTHLALSDAVVLEATSNAWLLYDQLEPLVGSVTVAHPLAVKLIAAARVKTDSRDTIKLAHLLAANLVPAVWVPVLARWDIRPQLPFFSKNGCPKEPAQVGSLNCAVQPCWQESQSPRFSLRVVLPHSR